MALGWRWGGGRRLVWRCGAGVAEHRHILLANLFVCPCGNSYFKIIVLIILFFNKASARNDTAPYKYSTISNIKVFAPSIYS